MVHKLKGLFAALLFGFLLWLAWSKYQNFLYQGQKPSESTLILNKLKDQGFPEIKTTDLDGKAFELAQLKGKIVIVNFWASWCNPCVEEFPSLLKMLDHYKGEVVLVGISGDSNAEDIHKFLSVFKAKNANLTVIWDKEMKIAKSLGTFALPESYILGRDLKLIRKIAGVDDWASADAIGFFDELVQTK